MLCKVSSNIISIEKMFNTFVYSLLIIIFIDEDIQITIMVIKLIKFLIKLFKFIPYQNTKIIIIIKLMNF